MTIRLIIDGGGDLPESMVHQHQLKIVPLNLQFGDEAYKTPETIDLRTFHQKLKQSEELPSSSSPSPHDFYKTYKDVSPEDSIIVLALTQGLSSTYESAEIGKEMLLEEEPHREIAVLNTKTASSGIALLVDEAATKMQEGFKFHALVSHMEERIEKTTTLFILKTLENVIKGGRLSKVKGQLAETLNVKLLMKATDDDGAIEVIEKVRGNKKSIRRFVEQIGDYGQNFEDQVIAMSHCNDKDRGKSVLEIIQDQYKFNETIFTEMGPLISTHAGEGALVIAFFKD